MSSGKAMSLLKRQNSNRRCEKISMKVSPLDLHRPQVKDKGYCLFCVQTGVGNRIQPVGQMNNSDEIGPVLPPSSVFRQPTKRKIDTRRWRRPWPPSGVTQQGYNRGAEEKMMNRKNGVTMSKCSKCGIDVPVGVKCCVGCGSLMPQAKECPQCHAQCSSDLAFCGECGCPLDISDLDISEPAGTLCDVGNLEDSPGSATNEIQKAAKIGKAAERENECEPLIKNGTYEEHPKWFSLRCWRGRMSRGEYFTLYAIWFLTLGLFGLIAGSMFPVVRRAIECRSFLTLHLLSLLMPLLLYPLVHFKWTADVRRFHDIGWSGWWVLVLRICEAALLVLGVAFLHAKLVATTEACVSSFRELEERSLQEILKSVKTEHQRRVKLFLGSVWLFDFLAFLCFRGKSGSNKYGPDTAFRKQTGDVARTAQKVHVLIELKKMRDSGLISESEYEDRRSKVMERYQSP